MKLYRLTFPLVSAGLALGCVADGSSRGTSAKSDANPSGGLDAPTTGDDATAAQDATSSDDAPSSPDGTVAALPDSAGPGAFPDDCGDTPLTGNVAGLAAQCVGSGKTVVLLGGFPEGAAGMRPLANAVAGLGHRAVTLDLPGWGDSAAVVDASVGALSDALDAALESLGGPPATVVAQDIGAMVAWDLGARHSDAVGTIVALSTPPSSLADPLPEVYAMLGQAGAADILTANDFKGLRSLLGEVDPAVLSELEARWSTPGSVDAMLAFFRDNSSPDANTSRTPTLVVWGMADTVFPPITLTQLRGAADALELRVLPGAGHTLHRSALAEVAGLIDDVAKGLSPRESLPLPAGLIGKAPPSAAPIPAFSSVVDEKGKAVTPAELASQTTVLWFYPLASSFG